MPRSQNQNFSTIKFATPIFYCHGVSHEQKHFGTIFLSARNALSPQNGKFYFNCLLAVSEKLQSQRFEIALKSRVSHVQLMRNLAAKNFPFSASGQSRPSRRTLSASTWKATKEYLNQRATKIRVFSSAFSGPFPPTLFPSCSPHFPLQALFTLPPLLPSSPPPFPSDSVKRHLSRRHLSVLNFLFNYISDGGCTCEKEIRFRESGIYSRTATE